MTTPPATPSQLPAEPQRIETAVRAVKIPKAEVAMATGFVLQANCFNSLGPARISRNYQFNEGKTVTGSICYGSSMKADDGREGLESKIQSLSTVKHVMRRDRTPQTLAVRNVQKTSEGSDERVSKQTNETDGERGEQIQKDFRVVAPGLASVSSPVRRQANHKQLVWGTSWINPIIQPSCPHSEPYP